MTSSCDCATYYTIIIFTFILHSIEPRNCAFITSNRKWNYERFKIIPSKLTMTQKSIAEEVNMIAFNLDDTLFPIAPVIKDSNRVLLKEMKMFLIELDCGGGELGEVSEEEVNASTKLIRRHLAETDQYLERECFNLVSHW